MTNDAMSMKTRAARHRHILAVFAGIAALLVPAVYWWRHVSWTRAGRVTFSGAEYIHYIDGDDVILLTSFDALRVLDRGRREYVWKRPDLGGMHRIVGVPGADSVLLQNDAASFVRIDTRTGKILARFRFDRRGSYYCIPSPDGTSVLAGDGIIALDGTGEKLVCSVPDQYHQASPCAGAFSSDGTVAAMEARRGNQRVSLVLEPGGATDVRELDFEDAVAGPLLAIHKSAGVILAASDSAIEGYALDSGERLWSIAAPAFGVADWAIVPEQPIALAGTRGGSLLGIDCKTGRVVFARVMDGSKAIWQVEVSPSGKEVAISVLPRYDDPFAVFPRGEYVKLYQLADLRNDVPK